jgi:hypothetical protein
MLLEERQVRPEHFVDSDSDVGSIRQAMNLPEGVTSSAETTPKTTERLELLRIVGILRVGPKVLATVAKRPHEPIRLHSTKPAREHLFGAWTCSRSKFGLPLSILWPDPLAEMIQAADQIEEDFQITRLVELYILSLRLSE